MLTYSCPKDGVQPIASKEELHAFLLAGVTTGKGASAKTIKPTGVITCRELHENGTPHYHAYIVFAARVTTRNMRVFDFKNVHPNIRVDMSDDAIVKYVTKGGDYISEGVDVDAYLMVKAKKVGPQETAYRQAAEFARKGEMVKAASIMTANACGEYTKWHDKIEKAWDMMYTREREEAAPAKVYDAGWTTPLAELDLNAKIEGEDYVRTHVLVGPAGIGKTELALHLLRKAGCRFPVVVTNIEQLKAHHRADGVLFDECNVNVREGNVLPWPVEAQIGLVDTMHDRSLPARNVNAVLRRHVIRILTTNNLSRAIDVTSEAVARRVTVHALEDKLFA